MRDVVKKEWVKLGPADSIPERAGFGDSKCRYVLQMLVKYIFEIF